MPQDIMSPTINTSVNITPPAKIDTPEYINKQIEKRQNQILVENYTGEKESSSSLKTTIKQINFNDYNVDLDIKFDDIYNNDGEIVESKFTVYNLSTAEDTLKPDSIAYTLNFDLPDWGVEDYINDRSKWVKGIRSIGDEPGYFYFKVFFKFKTNYGLFGGALSENGQKLMTSNSALRYLNSIKGKFGGQMLYKQEQIPFRINALVKFVSGLSKINSDYPWLIKGISGLDAAMNTYTEKFDEERSIELLFNSESTDMKIINLLNLYKYACFDDINCKEIVPANLRKFDMMVVVYHVPVKYFQTAIMVAPKKNLSTGIFGSGSFLSKAENIINKTFNFLTTKSTYYKYKRMIPSNNNYSDMMSFHMFTFNNCEFDVSSFGKYFESEMKNEQAFQFENPSVKIKYDRVYYHQMNEWSQMFFGSDGFKYDSTLLGNTELDYEDTIRGDSNQNMFTKRLTSLKQAKEGSTFFDKNAMQYKSLIEYSESLITDGLMSMDMKDYYSFIDGNIYGKYGKLDSNYYKDKLSVLKTGNIRGNLYGKRIGPYNDEGYFNKKINLIHKGTIAGNLYGKKLGVDGIGVNRKNTEYLNKKLHWLNDGIINEEGVVKININDNGSIEKSGDLIDAYNDAKSDEFRRTTDDKLENLFNATPDYPFEQDPIKTKKKEIWNYALTGSSKSSSIGGVLDAAQNLTSFWKW